jgi:Tfp pilus assembly protein PilX
MITKLRDLIAGRTRGRDDGMAMILVMGSVVTLSLLMGATMTYAVNGQDQGRDNQDWHSALSAAQAGVEDYAARLNANAQYWRSIDCTNKALQGPKAGTNSCGWGPNTPVGWQNVQAGSTGAQFHYDVNTSTTAAGGGIRLTVTGRARDELRTLQVRVGKTGSTKFVYYTDFESADPANRTAYSPAGSTKAQCGSQGTAQAKYIWTGRTGCSEIQFASGDTLDGKVHFNDTPMIADGATFLKGFETADPGCKTGTRSNSWKGCSRATSGTGSGKPSIPSGQYAEYADVLNLPDNSDALLESPGCHYTGDTRIRFHDNGTMTVWSKKTTAVETGCGLPGTASGRLGHANGATVNIPDGEIVYAKNGTGGTSECTAGQIGDGLPVAGDLNFKGSENATFFCGTGNIYVEGTVKGRLGIGAQNNVVVTGDLLIQGVAKGAVPTGNSMIALVASNSVVVYHPWVETTTQQCGWEEVRVKKGNKWVYENQWICNDVTTTSEGLPAANRYIYASIQTLQRSFWVQAYNKGTKRGDLVVFGSIAQRWRGIVGTSGTGGTGYIKDYKYDQRLTNDVPPGIQDFTNGAWEPSVTGEIPPVYGCVKTACTST